MGLRLSVIELNHRDDQSDDLAICRQRLEVGLQTELRERKGFGGQASKSIRWMPWHQEAMKDVVKLR